VIGVGVAQVAARSFAPSETRAAIGWPAVRRPAEGGPPSVADAGVSAAVIGDAPRGLIRLNGEFIASSLTKNNPAPFCLSGATHQASRRQPHDEKRRDAPKPRRAVPESAMEQQQAGAVLIFFRRARTHHAKT
jgi:hypothetical protein